MLARGAGALGRGCYGLWGRGQRRTRGRDGQGRGRPPESSPVHAGPGAPNSRPVLSRRHSVARSRQAAIPRETRRRGVADLQELGSLDPRPQLISLQTWSCLLPRPPRGGGGSFPSPGGAARPRGGAGAGGGGRWLCSAPTRRWPGRGSEGRKPGKQSPRSASGKGNASAGGEGREGRDCQSGWRPRAGRRGSGANRRDRAGRRRHGRCRGRGPRSDGLPLPPLLGLACLLSIPTLACATGREGSWGRGLFIASTHLGLPRRARLLLSFTG